MVAERTNAITQERQFLIRPDCSLSWRGSVIVFCGISLISLTIALGFLAQGLWMVLPFAGLELLVLGGAFYHCALKLSRCEMISIGGSVIAIQRGRRTRREFVSFPREDAAIELIPPSYRGHPTRLFIGVRQRMIEIGRCLSDEERDRLARELNLGIHVSGLQPA